MLLEFKLELYASAKLNLMGKGSKNNKAYNDGDVVTVPVPTRVEGHDKVGIRARLLQVITEQCTFSRPSSFILTATRLQDGDLQKAL